MNLKAQQVLSSPPKLMKCLISGFDAISNQIGLILFPVVLDALLWLGPRLKVSEFLQVVYVGMPWFQETGFANQVSTIWEEINLLAALRTYPIGVPSLHASRFPTGSPLGTPLAWQLRSAGEIVTFWVILSLFGLAIGTLYFHGVAQAALLGKVDWRKLFHESLWEYLQILFLSFLLLVLLLMVFLPFSCLLSVLLFTGIGIGGMMIFLIFFLGLVLVWLLFPLIFTPHGILINHQHVWASVKESVQLVRFTLPTTSLLIFVLLLISEGLDILWNIPTDTSWFALVGVWGHAFIATSLIATSFIYYRDARQWVQSLVQQANLPLA